MLRRYFNRRAPTASAKSSYIIIWCTHTQVNTKCGMIRVTSGDVLRQNVSNLHGFVTFSTCFSTGKKFLSTFYPHRGNCVDNALTRCGCKLLCCLWKLPRINPYGVTDIITQFPHVFLICRRNSPHSCMWKAWKTGESLCYDSPVCVTQQQYGCFGSSQKHRASASVTSFSAILSHQSSRSSSPPHLPSRSPRRDISRK